MLRFASFALVASIFLGCGDDGAGSGAGSSGTAGTAGTAGTTSSAAAGGINRGSPHTPETGCQMGFVPCSGWCVDTTNDSEFCGGCNTPCVDVSLTCEAGMCVSGACPGGMTCGGEFIRDRNSNADHCGSCFNNCADDALCFGGACIDGGGDGTGCASPMFWNLDDEERVGFHFAPALTTAHTFPCGPLEELPTRWFRFTATKDSTAVEVRATGPDDFIIEVFDAMTCAPASSLACNDDDSGLDPEVTVPTVEGKTYFVAVGLKGQWSGKSASIRADH